jgi:ubiquinone/menaquinone biosynthesis C-methylase UbiE
MEVDGKERARRTWGASPTGSIAAAGAEPGTQAFFERALKFRREEEQSWLPDVVPFHAMAGRRVLEIGFGPGFDALTFLQNRAIYSGIDITPENVERARKHLAPYGLHPDVQEADAEELPFSDASFDVVYSNGVLHHLPDVEKALREAFRVLRPGGALYMLVYHRNSLIYRLTLPVHWILEGSFGRETFAQRLQRIEASTAEVRPIVNVYSRKQAADLIARCGFRIGRIAVRKFLPEDLPMIPGIKRLYRFIPRRVLHTVGRIAGWYVIVHATRPRDPLPSSS